MVVEGVCAVGACVGADAVGAVVGAVASVTVASESRDVGACAVDASAVGACDVIGGGGDGGRVARVAGMGEGVGGGKGRLAWVET